MVITSAINIDMQYKYVNAYVDAVQYDVNSRNVEITLLKAGNRVDVPVGSTFEVKFKRPDGSSGSYSELSNGQAAVTVKEVNIIVVWLSEVILSEAGTTVVSVCIKDGETEINTFSFNVNVQESPSMGTGLAKKYPNTYDATATPSDISDGKTAYVNGEKVLGTAKNASTTISLRYGISPEPMENTVVVWQDTIPQMSETYPYLWIEINTETKTSTGGSVSTERGIIGYYTNPGSGGNATLTKTQIDAIHGMFKVCVFDDTKDVSGAYAAFKTAFGITDDSGGEEEPDTPVEPDKPVTPEKTLTSISATYSGGNVAVGTDVSSLAGVVVTAQYSDGTSETVTGYTLSGTIAEGENIVTVTYEGKTATFTVTGVADSGEETVAEIVFLPNMQVNNNTIIYNEQRAAFVQTSGDVPLLDSGGAGYVYYPIPIPDGATSVTISMDDGKDTYINVFNVADGSVTVAGGGSGWIAATDGKVTYDFSGVANATHIAGSFRWGPWTDYDFSAWAVEFN